MNETPPTLPKLEPPTLEPMGRYWWVLLVVVLLWSLIGFFPWYMNVAFGGKEWEWGLDRPGVFGDSFGFVNALFSGLALAGVIVAIFLQRKELFEQRNQLYHQYIEVLESVRTQQESQRALASQAASNLISEALSLAQYYGRNDEFDPDGVRIMGDGSVGKERIYKSVTRDLTRATHQFVIRSLEDLDGFPIPDSFRELPYDLFLQERLKGYYWSVSGTSTDPEGKLAEVIQSLSSLDHGDIWQHPRISHDFMKEIAEKIRSLKSEIEESDRPAKDSIAFVAEQFKPYAKKLNDVLEQNKIDSLSLVKDTTRPRETKSDPFDGLRFQ